ncbi:RIB43A-like with coiled-coils protein 2 [Solea solea]|uniref:RIB43A-like with coiled-coils protein 2 n=1 Tax=Solea solea TaxID=90069 RepID=UPI00272D7058|nr:RIB43A-like with coiled-coils protein 2 [Solea solea]
MDIDDEVVTDRLERARIQMRRDYEAHRRVRIFNEKWRTIGIDKQALDMQVRDRLKQEEADKDEGDAYDGHMIHNSRVAYMNQIREKEKQRVCQKAIDNFRHENQQFCDRLEFDLNDPDRLRKTKLEHGHVSLSGLLGEDLNYYDRLQRQKDQFKSWLIQQQNDKASVRHEQQLEDDQYDQFVLKMDNTALQIQRLQKQRRKAEAISTNEHNSVKTEEDKHRQALESAEAENQLQRQCATTSVGVPGLWPSTDKRPPPESRQKIMQFQKYQMEERKRAELEKKKEEERHARFLLNSSHKTLLLQREQAKVNGQLRRHLDSANVELAQIQEAAGMKRGHIYDDFFSQFNRCSR